MGFWSRSYHSGDAMPRRPWLSRISESFVVLCLVASRAAPIPLRVGSSCVVVWREWMPLAATVLPNKSLQLTLASARAAALHRYAEK